MTGEDAELAERLRRSGFKIYESHSVRAIHLGIPRSLGQFVRRQAWYGQGMFGDLRLWKPVTTILLYLALIVLGLLNFYFMPGPIIVRAAIFLLLLNMIPALAVGYRLSRLGYIDLSLALPVSLSLFLPGAALWPGQASGGNVARTYRKEN